MAVKLVKNEHHQVVSRFSYDMPDSEITARFGSVERFREVISHSASEGFGVPEGEPPTDDEADALFELLADYETERTDDWVTERKGGFEVSYSLDAQQGADE